MQAGLFTLTGAGDGIQGDAKAPRWEFTQNGRDAPGIERSRSGRRQRDASRAPGVVIVDAAVRHEARQFDHSTVPVRDVRSVFLPAGQDGPAVPHRLAVPPLPARRSRSRRAVTGSCPSIAGALRSPPSPPRGLSAEKGILLFPTTRWSDCRVRLAVQRRAFKRKVHIAGGRERHSRRPRCRTSPLAHRHRVPTALASRNPS